MSIRVLTSGSDGGTNSNGRKIFRGLVGQRRSAGRDAFYGIMGRVLEYAGRSGGIAVRSERASEKEREREFSVG